MSDWRTMEGGPELEAQAKELDTRVATLALLLKAPTSSFMCFGRNSAGQPMVVEIGREAFLEAVGGEEPAPQMLLEAPK